MILRTMQLALEKENSTTIGFVVASLFAGAIDKAELRAWADHVLATNELCPLYVVDLSTFDQMPADVFNVIGFVPHCDLVDSEEDALVGIAYARGRNRFEPIPTKEQALKLLRLHPQVLARFRVTFPFIDLNRDGVS
jgi:hypothetical protein